MDVYLKLPGHAGASTRKGYRGWVPLQALQFERPPLEKEGARFTVYRMQDALSRVFARQQQKGAAFSRIRIHHVEGTEAISKLRFDDVVVASWTLQVDPDGGEAHERVEFVAGRWQVD